jgi:hypothetical protein
MGRFAKVCAYATFVFAFVLPAAAQRPPYKPASQNGEIPAVEPANVVAVTSREVHVDERCRILPGVARLPSGKKTKLWSDPTICHLENVFDTDHTVQTVVGTELQRSDVEIYEQQYVLGNPSQQPELFIIQQPARKGLTIEGDPPPFRVASGKEYYRAWVQPGETVQLHVGMRKVTPLKAKALKVSGKAQPPAPAGPPPASVLPEKAPNSLQGSQNETPRPVSC